tara:strand:+ start:2984 stop:3091 length:108 start_codon:yes stop_codon:yes gene_type:complete
MTIRDIAEQSPGMSRAHGCFMLSISSAACFKISGL